MTQRKGDVPGQFLGAFRVVGDLGMTGGSLLLARNVNRGNISYVGCERAFSDQIIDFPKTVSFGAHTIDHVTTSDSQTPCAFSDENPPVLVTHSVCQRDDGLEMNK